MELITNLDQLITNINTLESYLVGENEYETEEATLLVKRGTCFVAYQIGNEVRFAPSRFLGYKTNVLEQHSASSKDGKETNKVICSILKVKPTPSDDLELVYFKYCHSLGIKPNEKGAFGAPRKFWKLKLKNEFQSNIQLDGEFPEGKIVERMHMSRERNLQVMSLAKQHFKRLHGRLFCQVCGFDFEKTYGSLGFDFIEGHHTIAVSEMAPDHKTRIENIAMLCSNCHRMVHKKRPWLSMLELETMLKK